MINVATRAGTNSFHGQIGGEFTNNQLNPRPRGYYQRSAANANVAEFFAPKEDTSRTFYPGGIFSGPILADKVYFTAGLFPTYNRIERYVEYPTGTRAFTQENTNYYSLGPAGFFAEFQAAGELVVDVDAAAEKGNAAQCRSPGSRSVQ